MAIETTPGKLLLSKIFPKGTVVPVLDKKTIGPFIRDLARSHPDKAGRILSDLIRISSRITRQEAAGSFDISDFRYPEELRQNKTQYMKEIASILQNKELDEKSEAKLADYLVALSKNLTDQTFDIALKNDNVLAQHVLSGSRGNKEQLKRLLAGDTVYTGYKDNVIPFPVLNSYSEGVFPYEYWAATYGARRGLAATKLSVADSGYLLKLLVGATHRLIVTDTDGQFEPSLPIGLPVDIDDPDNEGALLAIKTGEFEKNTAITPAVIERLKSKGYKKILIRSPITTLSPSGVYARDAGIREEGKLPEIGSIPGITAAQAIGERLTQTALGSKSVGGIAGREIGFSVIERLVNVPKQFKGGAVHSTEDGKVTNITKNELGQTIVYIEGVPHEINPGFEAIVKVGDKVETGDVLSDGIPNPSILVAHKGIGEGRRLFVNIFTDEMKKAGLTVNRRNVEFLARGLIDHVEITESFEDYNQSDIIPYSAVASKWSPREDSVSIPVQESLNYYIETPVLHYTIGTRITPSVIKTLKEFGIDKVIVNKNPPPFQPLMVRASAILEFDPNWITRLYGSNQLRSLMRAAQQGAEAPLADTSFVLPKILGIDLAKWSRSLSGKER